MIHHTAIVGPEVQLGKNVSIGPYAVLFDRIVVGDNTSIGAHVVVGGEAEHSQIRCEIHPRHYTGKIFIGSDVVIREFTQVCRPIAGRTEIGDRTYIMGHCYVAHDCILSEDVVLSNGTLLGGWTRVMCGANLGMGVAVHQHTTIGHYAMVAANAAVVKDVPPLAKYIPGKPLGLNTVAVERCRLPVKGESIWQALYDGHGRELREEWDSLRHVGRASYA